MSVAVAPKITPFQVDPTLRLGERLTLTCAVSKGDPPLTIGWMVNGHVVTSAGGEIKTMQINARQMPRRAGLNLGRERRG